MSSNIISSSRIIDILGWGLFIIWVGISFLWHPFPDGIGALGVGSIVVLTGIIRIASHRSISWQWIIIASFFIGAGICEYYHLPGPWLGIALIGVGFILLRNWRYHKYRHKRYIRKKEVAYEKN